MKSDQGVLEYRSKDIQVMGNYLSPKKPLAVPFILILVGLIPSTGYAQNNPKWIAEKKGPFEYSPGYPPDHHFNGLEIARKVFVYYRSYVDPNSGEGWHRVLITNGYKGRGFTVCSETEYYGDNRTLRVGYQLGVDPEKSRNEKRDISMSPEFWKSVKSYRIRAGWCPQGKIGNKIIDGVEGFLKTVGSVFVKDNPQKEANIKYPPAPNSIIMHYVWASVYCERNGYTGHLRISADSPNSCQAAKSKILSDAEAGRSCPKLFGPGTAFTGKIEYSLCGTGWAQKK